MVGLFQQQELSHRQSCRLAGISRSVDIYSASEHNQTLLERLKALAFEHIHYGYRLIWALLKREGCTVSLKRVKRLWKLNGLQVPKRKPKQRRRGPCVQQYPCQAVAPNHVWSLDFPPRGCFAMSLTDWVMADGYEC
jgi:putative transposase